MGQTEDMLQRFQSGQVHQMLQSYKEIRDRLRKPSNAVPDTGINLKKTKIVVAHTPKPFTELPPPPETQTPPPPPPPLPLPIQSPQELFCRRQLLFSSVLDLTAREFGLHLSDIKRQCRKKKFSFPRQIAFYLGSRHTPVSLAGMGRYLGMDHTTVIYAVRKIKRLIEFGDEKAIQILQVEAKLLAYIDQLAIPANSEPHLVESEVG